MFHLCFWDRGFQRSSAHIHPFVPSLLPPDPSSFLSAFSSSLPLSFGASCSSRCMLWATRQNPATRRLSNFWQAPLLVAMRDGGSELVVTLDTLNKPSLVAVDDTLARAREKLLYFIASALGQHKYALRPKQTRVMF